MDVPYFIKKNLQMSSSDEATLKKSFGGNKHSLKLTLKTTCYHSCGCCDDSQSCEQLKKHVTSVLVKKKLDFEPQSPSITGNVCYSYNT